MPGHAEVERVLSGKQKTFVSGTGVITLTAGNTNLSMQDLQDIINACVASGQELVFTAGALKIRPKDSAL
jgi:hypothetical protein